MKLVEKYRGLESRYRYVLNAEELKDFIFDRVLSPWAVLEVYPETQRVLIANWEKESEPTLDDIRELKEWQDEWRELEDFDSIALWLSR
jgi:hypothetical protein